MSIDAIQLNRIRELHVRASSQPGRPAYVSAASGLVRRDDRLYVVADDELCLGVFLADGNEAGELVRLLPGELPLSAEDRKRRKPDFESLTMLPATTRHASGALLALGSGSKAARKRGVIVPFAQDGTLDVAGSTVADLTALFGIAADAVGTLNIEGALAQRDRFSLLQRGNKGEGINAIIEFDLLDVYTHLDGNRSEIRPTAVRRYQLGTMGDVPLSFSDAAALEDGSIVFAAIAEDTADAYADGPCAGAAIGIIDADGAMRRLFHVSNGAKIEGIHVQSRESGIELWCVSDADDAAIPAVLYRGTLPA